MKKVKFNNLPNIQMKHNIIDRLYNSRRNKEKTREEIIGQMGSQNPTMIIHDSGYIDFAPR